MFGDELPSTINKYKKIKINRERERPAIFVWIEEGDLSATLLTIVWKTKS